MNDPAEARASEASVHEDAAPADVIAFKHPGFSEFFTDYVGPVPLPHAIERCIECVLYTNHRLERPVLDVGCGDGIFSSVLFGERVDTGIDPDERELRVAASLDAYEELIECSGASVPKPTGSYRTIFSNSVLEHIPDLKPVLVEMHRLLHDDGQVIVTVPVHRFVEHNIGHLVLSGLRLQGLDRKWQRFFRNFWGLYHVHSSESWRTMFESAGFEIKESFEYKSPRLTLMRESLMPFSIPGAFAKIFINRWTLLPSAVRRVLLKPMMMIVRAFVRREETGGEACLLFMRCGKGPLPQ
jgi:SAM-dependent methyltransferase